MEQWGVDIEMTDMGGGELLVFCPLENGVPMIGMSFIGGVPDGSEVIGAFGSEEMDHADVERWMDAHRELILQHQLSDALRERLNTPFDPDAHPPQEAVYLRTGLNGFDPTI